MIGEDMIVALIEMIEIIVGMIIEEIAQENIVEIDLETEIHVQVIEIIDGMIIEEMIVLLAMKEMIDTETLETVIIGIVVDSIIQFRKKYEFLLSKRNIRYFLQSKIPTNKFRPE